MDASDPEWEQWFLLSSDRHHDNAHTNWFLERKHLDQCIDRNAGIFDAGDLMCLMQGKWDKRADKSQLRPELQEGTYLDAVIDMCADFYAPYAEQWISMGWGNHETSVLKRHETHMTQRLIEAIRSRTGHTIEFGGYKGWVEFVINKTSTSRVGYKMWYHHGYGGGGPVTKGVIQTNRRAAYVSGADILHTGHTHDSWIVPHEVVELRSGKEQKRRQYHVSTPGYKDEYTDEGWHVERGGPPKPVGAAWLRFYREGSNIDFEITEAK